MGKLTILDDTGDTQLAWRQEDIQQVQDAEMVFGEMILSGYFAIGNKSGKIMDKFDPEEDEITMMPMLEGG